MTKHKGKRIFITGIPASGKSYLANKTIKEIGGIHIALDDIREELTKNQTYAVWANFYFNQDENIYYRRRDGGNKRWDDLVQQSEALWPAFLETIEKYKNEPSLVIFEGVNILPHLAKQDLEFSGYVLLGENFEEIFERNKANPRWGNTEKLQKREAQEFFYEERPRYKAEADKYGYQTFEDSEDAFREIIKHLTD